MYTCEFQGRSHSRHLLYQISSNQVCFLYAIFLGNKMHSPPPPNPKIFHDGEVKKLTLEALVHLGCYTMYVDSRLLMFWNRLLFPDNQRSQLHLWQKFEIWYILTTGQDCNPALRLLNIRELPDCTVSEHLAGHQK